MHVVFLAALVCSGVLLGVGYRLVVLRQTGGKQGRIEGSRKGSFVGLLSHSSPRRMLISLSLLGFLTIALVVQTIPVISGSLQGITSSWGLSLQNDANVTREFRPQAHLEPSTASSKASRISFHAHDQYDTEYQRTVWGPSACSGITLAVVMNAYGHRVRVVDLIEKELEFGVWSVDLGLLREEGMTMTADAFGFHTDASRTRPLHEIIAIANTGTPVIVSVRDSTYFSTGHFIVINGGDDQYVTIIDSSDYNFQRMTHAMFISMWQHYSAVVTPKR